MAEQKSKRVKNPHPQPEGVPAGKRIKAGAPGSTDALPGDPESPKQKATAKKSAPSPEK